MIDPLTSKVHSTYSKIERLHTEVVMLMAEVYDSARGRLSDESLTDIGFLMKHAASMLDDTRKEISAKQTLVDKLVAVRVASAQMKSASSEDRLIGSLASATPNVKVCAKIPEPGTPAHAALLRHFGIENAEAVTSGIVDLRFSGISDYLTKLAAEGRNPPEGLTQTFEKVTVTYRARKG